MPTGYTAGVVDGTVTDFNEFALQCCRAMGVTITMRDKPTSTPIPEAFEPSTYSKDQIAKTQAEIDAFMGLGADELDAAYDEYVSSTEQRNQHNINKTTTTVSRLEAMLEQVEAWEPPTDEHQGLKDFMRDQLVKTIDFDGNPYTEKIRGRHTWEADKRNKLLRDLEYHRKSWKEEQERVASRNLWLKQFRESLPHTLIEEER